ncbi:MAG TPA: pseudouridine synthase, partial [Tepidisphaeraceae bacterium]|nr:pseudouridine synthase [Tepidisphaeraceae bacterium]
MKQRLQKLLAAAGVASRRHVEEMIRQGRVSVNGQVRTQLPILVDPAADRVAVDGESVALKASSAEPRIYILLNKPKDVYSTNVAQGEQKRAIDLLPPEISQRLYPVGRLDAQTRGLLLLTNDGELTHQLSHPRYGISRTYRVVVDGFVDGKGLAELAAGVWLGDPRTGRGFKTGKAQFKIVKRSRDRSVIDLTLREGRNGEVRRMLARMGHKVRDLTRIRLGPLTIDGLAPGQLRALTRVE